MTSLWHHQGYFLFSQTSQGSLHGHRGHNTTVFTSGVVLLVTSKLIFMCKTDCNMSTDRTHLQGVRKQKWNQHWRIFSFYILPPNDICQWHKYHCWLLCIQQLTGSANSNLNITCTTAVTNTEQVDQRQFYILGFCSEAVDMVKLQHTDAAVKTIIVPYSYCPIPTITQAEAIIQQSHHLMWHV